LAKRDLDTARQLALGLREKVLAADADFAALAMEHSEDVDRRANGGYLGTVIRRELSDAFDDFEKAAFALEIGGFSEVVESPLGFHILRRVPLEEWRGRVIFVGFKLPSGGAKRSREEALALAEKVVRLARRPRADFATLARRYSEGPERIKNGALGVFGRGERPSNLCDAFAKLVVGEISEPVESKDGFHVLLSEPLDARRFALIRIPPGEDEEGTRDAKELAKSVRRLATTQDFAALAREHSDHARAKYGGDLGSLPAERLPPYLREAGAKLKKGRVSQVIEDRRGLFVLKRL
jgi:parvulin-like peptidyl-prolyl isomerase